MATPKLLISFDYKNEFIIVRDYTDDRNHGTLKLVSTDTNEAAALIRIVNEHTCKRIDDGIVCGYVIDRPVYVFNINARLGLGLSL